MPIGFLTAAERERLSRGEEHIPEDDLSVFFLLSEADHQAVNGQHDDHTRLGFALQLCTLRYLEFVPHALDTAPSSAIGYVAEQLHVLPEVIDAYGARIATRTTHLQQVQRHLGFRRATPLDMYALQTWLLERALEHDKPTLLLHCFSWPVTSCAANTLSARVSRAWSALWLRLASRLTTRRGVAWSPC
jgi:TnpA family transposase